MNKIFDVAGPCGEQREKQCDCFSPEVELKPLEIDRETITAVTDNDIACCGGPPPPPASPDEKPGYAVCSFVKKFEKTQVGNVPIVNHRLSARDRAGSLLVRLGIGRDRYCVSPGLYGVGAPGPESPVLVTANFKLTFDTLRKELASQNAWILVLDTHGINVWCAAGKKTFSTQEVVKRVRMSGLDQLVSHRELILPQLGATGVSGHQVKKTCGIQVVWGPVRASDIGEFLKNKKKAARSMRRVTFSLGERLVLIPVELSLMLKPALYALLAVFILSGIGSGLFSFSNAWNRGLIAFAAFFAGVVGGAVAVPALLPWIPGRSFAVKGAATGLAAGIAMAILFQPVLGGWEIFALMCLCVTVSSFVGMNFTGATPFTSPSGVEKEMRKAMPIQAGVLLLAILAWIGGAIAA